MGMFCFQCEQAAGCKACTGKMGVCGKSDDVGLLQDDLNRELIGLACAYEGKTPPKSAVKIMIEGLFTTVTNVNFDAESVKKLIDAVRAETAAVKPGFTPDCGAAGEPLKLWSENEDIRSLKSLILFGLRGVAAYAYHALVLGYRNDDVDAVFFSGLRAVGKKDAAMEDLLPVVTEVGNVNLKCMEMLDKANTDTYGTQAPTTVPLTIEKGPFIVVSGHDLHDLHQLLEQTKDKGINIYTHGEMLPAHAYPKLKAYPHLRGNFGTAWQNQQKEFADIPAPVLFTTNCLMPPRDSYRDRIFTTALVAYPGLVHITSDGDGKKDFTPIINKALELGGYGEDKVMTGINGGAAVTTGFGHGTVLSAAGTVVDAVKAGAIRHFFLVGGCDGAKPGRNYYTEFVQKTPKDTVVLTLACGKYRFNDLDLGKIGDLPRLMDMGQCNDTYSAIKVAQALADAFGCGVNDLPLTLVLSWYEQKAVCILLTLLALGIKNIYLGPTLPPFISPNVLKFLVENFNISPISTPEEDLKKILKQ